MVDMQELDKLGSDVAVDWDNYVDDSSLGMVPPEGTYDIVIRKFDVSRDETGRPDGRSVELEEVEITGAVDEAAANWVGRTVRYLRVWTTPYLRNGVKVSQLANLIRGIDDEKRFSTFGEAIAILQEAQDRQTPIRVKFIWEAFDKDFYASEGGASMTPKSDEQKDLRRKASVKYMRNFRQLPDGTYVPEAQGPSGNMLTARVTLDRVIPSSKVR